MKITFVLNGLTRGGGARVAFEYARHLQARGHDVSVVYPMVLPFRKRLSLGEFVLWILPSVRYFVQQFRHQYPTFDTDVSLIRVLALHPRLARQLEKQIPDADAIIATAWSTAYAVNALSTRKGYKWYFVQMYEIWDIWDERTCWRDARRLKRDDETCALAMARVLPRDNGLRAFKERVDRSYTLPLHKLTISAWLRRLVREHFGEQVGDVIPNGVNFDVFFQEGERREKPGPITVLMPFRPMAWKGFDDGLDALKQIRRRHPTTRFIVFGCSGLVKDRRVRTLPKWVKYHDCTSDTQLRALYNDAHVFVLPSWVEGFPLPPMEAMACGCAVVTTDAGGFSDYLTDGENALITPIQDPLALAQSVCTLIEDENARRRLAVNGSRFVQRFTWEASTDALEGLLKSCI